jgi:hypothetical protein
MPEDQNEPVALLPDENSANAPFASKICRIREDYQSGSRQPHSKGCGHFK